MHISKDKNTIEICFGNETLSFGGLARMRKKGMSERGDELLMVELNRLWNLYDVDTQEKVFQCYKDLDEISTEGMEVIEKHLPTIVARLVELHPAEVFKNLYPRERVWIPESLHDDFTRMSPNYTEGMTYTAPDYYNLIIFALQLKPLLPVFGLLQVYDTQRTTRRRSQEERDRNDREQLARRRATIQRTVMAFNYIMETEMANSAAVGKLRTYLNDSVKNFQREMQRGSSTIETIAAYCGFGTDMLEDYLMAYAVVNVLAQQIVGAIRNHSLNDNAQLVTEIYFSVKGEVETGLANKLTMKNVSSKPSIKVASVCGERGKFSSIDLVSARSDGPIKEPIRGEMQFTHPEYQRSLYKAMNIDLTFDQVQMLIENAKTFIDEPWYEVQEWLVALATHRFVDRRTIKDMDPIAPRVAMGWAQAVFIHYGMYDIAQMLSCRVRPRDLNLLGYIINPYTSAFKEDVDRYYPQGYTTHRGFGAGASSPLYQSVQVFIGLMNRYEYQLTASNQDVAALLRIPMEVVSAPIVHVPNPDIGIALVEMSLIQAKNKLKEVDFYTL